MLRCQSAELLAGRDLLEIALRCSHVLEQPIRIETGGGSGVARRTGLIDLQQHRVAIAVEPGLHDLLRVPTGLPLDPQLLPGAGPVRALTGGQRQRQGLVVHPRLHLDVPGGRVLDDGGDEPVSVALQAPGDGGVEGCRTQRRTSESSARASLTSRMLTSPKWKMLAARTAFAPDATAGGKWLAAPAPPEAMTGMDTTSRTAASISVSKPSLVPSASMELSRISPTPSSSPFLAQATASRPADLVPPCVVTS